MSSDLASSSSPAGTALRHGVEVPGSSPGPPPGVQEWANAAQWGFENLPFVTGNAAALRLLARACELHLHQCMPSATAAERLEEHGKMCRGMLQRWHGERLGGSFEEWYAAAAARLTDLPRQPLAAGASKATMAELESCHAFEARPDILIEYLEDERDRLELERKQPPGRGYKIGKGFQSALALRMKPKNTKKRVTDSVRKVKISQAQRAAEERAHQQRVEDEYGF